MKSRAVLLYPFINFSSPEKVKLLHQWGDWTLKEEQHTLVNLKQQIPISRFKKKSLKPSGSYKHMRRISGIAGGDRQDEKDQCESQPILQFEDQAMDDQKEVVVKIDNYNNNVIKDVELPMDSDSRGDGGSNSTIWREGSYEFWNGGGEGGSMDDSGKDVESQKSGSFDFTQNGGVGADDPPSKLIGQFLNQQESAGVISLDMDLEMDELRHNRLPPIAENPGPVPSSREVRVSFREPTPDRVDLSGEISLQRHYTHSSDSSEEDHVSQPSFRRMTSNLDGDEVLRCTSNASFRKSSLMSRAKTKSRLFDSFDDYKKSGVLLSGQLKSGFLGKGNNDEDDEDPFAVEDLPDDIKKAKVNVLYIIEWVSLICITAAFICSLSISVIEKMRLWELQLWKWELLILVLICGRLLSGWIIRFLVFFIERNFLLRKRVLYFVYGLKKPVQNCLWLSLVLIAWHFMFDEKVKRRVKTQVLPLVTKILVCFLVSTLIWLVKTLLVKVLASSFHVSTFFDRIQDSLFNQYVIGTLLGPPLVEIRHTLEDEENLMDEVRKLQNAGVNVPPGFRETFSSVKSGRQIGSGPLQRKSNVGMNNVAYSGPIGKPLDYGITIDHLHKMNQKNISAWNMKRLMKIVRQGLLSTLDEHLAGQNPNDDEHSTQIKSEREAKAAAKQIFSNVARPGSKHIYFSDLMRFMREEEAFKTMNLFETQPDSNKVTRRALKNWVVNAFRERRALALTLNDTKTAVNKLHHMVNIIVGVVIVIVGLLILGIATSRVLVVVSSQVLVVVFIFGNTCKTIFEAIIFLFVMHPFDVGDRCEIDGVQMVVEEMNILTTVFLRYDNQKIYYPNSVLSTMPISNYYRSPDMGDAIEFCIHISTPMEKIALMKKRITDFIENKKDHWYPAPTVVLKEVEDMNRLVMAVWLQHTINHQDMGKKFTRRELVIEEMLRTFRDLEIEYRMLPVDVNVRNLPALSSSRLPSNWTTCFH